MIRSIKSILFISFLGANSAWAQQPIAGESENPTIIAQRFTPAPSPSDFLVTFAMPTMIPRGFSVGFFSDFQLNPVTVRFVFNTDEGQELGGNAVNVVSSQVVTHLMGTFSIFDRVEISFDAPFFVRQQGEGLSKSGGPGQGIPSSGIGDPRIYLRARAWDGPLGDDGTLSIGGVGGLSIPMGDAGGFMGEGGATGSIRAVGDLHWKQLQLVGNVGYLTRPARSFLTLIVDDEIFYNIAVAYQINPTIAASLEMYGGANADSDIRDVDSSHLEADLAFRLQVDNGIAITGGLGTGLIAGVGNPDVRVFAGVRYQPTRKGDSDKDGIVDSSDKCPRRPETDNGFKDEDGCPDNASSDQITERVTDPDDEDADGVVNSKDKCPESPEDSDKFQDEDGCPDFDNDQDGIKDSTERCDDEAEDKDGFEDEDGCPDLDNDQDEIADKDDKCPNEIEDKDGHADTDGCPELDADVDGVVDTEDPCPDQSETFNGITDEDGCPDEGASSLAFPVGNVGEVSGADKIRFQKGKVQLVPDSLVVLDELVYRMRAAKETKLLITVSPEKTGKPAEDAAKDRAEVLRGYLIGFGIEEERISTTTNTQNTGTVSLTLSPITAPK